MIRYFGPRILQGKLLRLRTVRERDLDDLYSKLNDLQYRGSFFPLGMEAEPVFRRKFEEDGFWSKDEGMLPMIDPSDEIVGEIEFYPIVHYLTGTSSPTWSSEPIIGGRGTRRKR